MINASFLFVVYEQHQDKIVSYTNIQNFILACQKELINETSFQAQGFDQLRQIDVSLTYCICVSEALENNSILKRTYMSDKVQFSDLELNNYLDSPEGSIVTNVCTEKSLL